MRENRDDKWFAQLLRPLQRAPENGAHPSEATLHSYMRGRLPDAWRLGAEPANADDWMMTEVSQHALVCIQCQAHLAQMRRAELKRKYIPTSPQMSIYVSGAFSVHLKAFVVATILLFVVNWMQLLVFPSFSSRGPCNPDMANTALGASQAIEFPTKPGEVNKPIELPGICSTSQSPKPRQIWWAPWMFALWSPLLVIHLIWNWLTGYPLGRRRHSMTASGGLAPARGLLSSPLFR